MVRFVLVSLLLGPSVFAQSILPPPPVPAGNPMSPDKVLLGKALFWDEQLSSSRSVACGTCHIPARGGADPRAAAALHPGADGVFGTDDDVHGSPGVAKHTATGELVPSEIFGVQVQVTGRRAPSMINAAYSASLFVDGRATDVFRDPVTQTVVLPSGGALESQIAAPPVNSTEMGHPGRTWTDIANDLSTRTPLALASNVPAALQQFVAGHTYDGLFVQVFGSPGVTPVRIVFAIAAYERSLISDQSPFDRYLAGLGTLTNQQTLGLARFQTFCATCHTDLDPAVLTTGPELDDFRNIGVRPPAEDLGRGAITAAVGDRGKFRVPGLRNVALRAGYFHNGSQQTLAQVVDFYARGGDFADNRDPLVDAINGHIFIADNLQLQALLNALTDPRVAQELPPFDRPRLWSEGLNVPGVYGSGTAGTCGLSPHIVALGPAYLGNDVLGVAVEHIAPNLFTALLLDIAGSPVPITPTPLSGHGVHLALTPALQMFLTGLSLPAPSGSAYATAVFHLPANPALVGTYWLQWVALDPNGPSGIASSNALRLPVY
ncbi:MAG: cytochrome c peroxidase [Planctomycetota bacterium]